jgi:3-deoxy-manno-octulosonate cytidylyltransferase (CMP-KDO synthetase)
MASTRLPGKPLRTLGERTIIELVAERACACAASLRQGGSVVAAPVVVATDAPEIAAVVERMGIMTALTSPDLPSGTDRIASALHQKQSELNLCETDLVVNIQGDEPFFSERDVLALVNRMIERPDAPMGTLAYRRRSSEMFLSSSVVKVVVDKRGFASYFSRSPIPWPRGWLGASGADWQQRLASGGEDLEFWHHLGVYAFRVGSLFEFTGSLSVSGLEKMEGLEQLRAVEHGWKILVEPATDAPHGIDTEEDLARARRLVEEGR